MDRRHRSTWRLWWALLATVALFAAACGTGDDAGGGEDGATDDRAGMGEFVGSGVFGGSFTDDTVDDAIARLAESGIAVVPDASGAPIVDPTEPASPMVLLRWQAHNLVVDAASNSGFRGADLDALVAPDPEIPDAPAPSQVLAAYVHGVDTPGAQLARELVGDQDLTAPDVVVFPAMVVTLFVSDIARATQELADASPDLDATEPGDESATPVMLGDDEIELISSSQPICPDFAGFINEVIGDIVKILKLPRITVPDTGIPILTQILQAGADLFVGFLNFAIDAAATFLIDGIKVLLKPVLDVVTTIAAVFAVTSQVVSALSPWAVRAEPADISAHRGVGAPATQEITLHVTVPGLGQWPDAVRSCARNLGGIELPSLHPHGGRVTWDHIDVNGVTNVAAKENVLDDTSRARITLDLGQETPQQHAKGRDDTALVKVSASIRRQEVEDFKATVRGLIRKLFEPVPAIIRAHLTYYSDHAADAILDHIADEVTDIRKVVWADVSYHGDPSGDDEEPPEGPAGDLSPASLAVCELLTDQEISSILGFVPDTVDPTSHEDLERELREHQAAGHVGPEVVRDERIVRAAVCEKGFNFSVVPGSRYETAAGGTNQTEAFEHKVGWGVHTFTDKSGPRDWIAETLRFQASLPPTEENVRYVHLDVGDEAIGSEYNEVILDGEVWRRTGKVIFQGRINFRVGKYLVSVWGNHDHVKSLSKDEVVRVGTAIAARLR